MTRKKALIYFIIFLVMFAADLFFIKYLKENPSAKFNDMCKIVMAPSCQIYLNKITKEKKYNEAIAIQKERIRQNEQVLNFFKIKTHNKILLFKTSKEANKSLIACIDKPNCKKDYFLIKVSDDTIKDIILDSLVVAEIQFEELNDPQSALTTLKHAKYIVKMNRFFFARPEAIKELDKQISQIKQKP